MPRKKVLPITDPGLTHVLAVGDAKMRTPIVEQVKSLGYSNWAAGSPKAAMNSFRNGLRAAVVVIVMADLEDGRAFAKWVDEHHPHAIIVFAGENGSEARVTAKYVIPHVHMARELPRILAHDLATL